MNTAIIACCKMEELYIREWIDWHLNICNFTHIFLCDNNDTGYKYQLKPLIQDYIDSGRVTVYNYNDIHPIQPHCYNDIYSITDMRLSGCVCNCRCNIIRSLVFTHMVPPVLFSL